MGGFPVQGGKLPYHFQGGRRICFRRALHFDVFTAGGESKGNTKKEKHKSFH
jgi:hypothetical protein